MSQLATGLPWKSECCLLLPDRGWKISSPLSLFDTSPAGELEHHNFLPLEKGRISFPLVCLYPQQRNLSITSSGRVARIIRSLLSPTKTVVEECEFSCWCFSGLGQELPKKFFVRLPFSWSLARGSRLFWELYCLCLLMVLRGRLLKLPIWEMWEAIRKPRWQPPCHFSSPDISRQSTFSFPPFRVFLRLFVLKCPWFFNCKEDLREMELPYLRQKWKSTGIFFTLQEEAKKY